MFPSLSSLHPSADFSYNPRSIHFTRLPSSQSLSSPANQPMEFDKQHSLSLKHKLKFFLCDACCDAEDDVSAADIQKTDKQHSQRHSTLSSWLKSELPVIKEVCAHMFSGKLCRNRRGNSSEFKYDPLSYALNFEDDSHLDEFPLRNFSSRLPPSPVKEMQNVVLSTPIAAWS